MTTWKSFAIGLLTFVAAHAIEVLLWTTVFQGRYDPWFLNSGRAGAFTIACLFGSSVVGGALGLSGVMIAAGAFVAMIAVLFLSPSGPGTLFPIVLAAGGAIALVSCGGGAWAGAIMARRTGR